MQIKEKIENWAKDVLKIDLPAQAGNVVLVHPKEIQNGDFTLILYPENIEKDFETLKEKLILEIERLELVKPRFINIYLSKEFFANQVAEIDENFGKTDLCKGEKTIIEYTVTNVLKPMHIGHLMGNVIGESLSRILEWNGAEVKRNNYQGDVGLHIAKALWGIQKNGGIIEGSISEKTKYIGDAYTLGSNAYEDDPNIQEEIKEINKKVFEKSDHELNRLYEWGRKVSLEHFEELYQKLDTKFDFYFFESEVTDEALKIVREFLASGLFEESDGAIVFHAEKFDPKLHTRVFVTQQGLPMYEAKDIAHAIRKYKEYKSNKSIIVTANEQDSYFKVMLRALQEINPEIASQTKHLSHGILKLPTGKMGSRKGNVITGEVFIEDVQNLVKEKIKDRDFEDNLKNEIAEVVAIGAIKYSILRQAIGGDIIFDFDKSLSFEGDSGPYLQYTYVRAKSVIEKSNLTPSHSPMNRGGEKMGRPEEFEITELERYLYRFPEVVERAGREYAPHHLVTYLTEIASIFNSFYSKEQIIDPSNLASSTYKLALTSALAVVLKNGLHLLGIKVPDRM